jgi:hypothetical protein
VLDGAVHQPVVAPLHHDPREARHDRLPHHDLAATSPDPSSSAARGAHATWGPIPSRRSGSGGRRRRGPNHGEPALMPTVSTKHSIYLSLSVCRSRSSNDKTNSRDNGFWCSVLNAAFLFLLLILNELQRAADTCATSRTGSCHPTIEHGAHSDPTNQVKRTCASTGNWAKPQQKLN